MPITDTTRPQDELMLELLNAHLTQQVTKEQIIFGIPNSIVTRANESGVDLDTEVLVRCKNIRGVIDSSAPVTYGRIHLEHLFSLFEPSIAESDITVDGDISIDLVVDVILRKYHLNAAKEYFNYTITPAGSIHLEAKADNLVYVGEVVFKVDNSLITRIMVKQLSGFNMNYTPKMMNMSWVSRLGTIHNLCRTYAARLDSDGITLVDKTDMSKVGMFDLKSIALTSDYKITQQTIAATDKDIYGAKVYTKTIGGTPTMAIAVTHAKTKYPNVTSIITTIDNIVGKGSATPITGTNFGVIRGRNLIVIADNQNKESITSLRIDISGETQNYYAREILKPAGLGEIVQYYNAGGGLIAIQDANNKVAVYDTTQDKFTITFDFTETATTNMDPTNTVNAGMGMFVINTIAENKSISTWDLTTGKKVVVNLTEFINNNNVDMNAISWSNNFDGQFLDLSYYDSSMLKGRNLRIPIQLLK